MKLLQSFKFYTKKCTIPIVKMYRRRRAGPIFGKTRFVVLPNNEY